MPEVGQAETTNTMPGPIGVFCILLGFNIVVQLVSWIQGMGDPVYHAHQSRRTSRLFLVC